MPFWDSDLFHCQNLTQGLHLFLWIQQLKGILWIPSRRQPSYGTLVQLSQNRIYNFRETFRI